jgi:hypothetical protein
MFRFTIRDMLWLTVVVALLGAWFVDRRFQATATKQAQEFARIAIWAANYGDVEPGSQEWLELEGLLRREWIELVRKREERRGKPNANGNADLRQFWRE